MKASTDNFDSKARVLVVDDHPLFREGVVQLINRQSDLVCCGEAASMAEAQAASSIHKPDVVLLDLRLGHADGLELIKSLKAQLPGLRILVISQFDESIYAERVLHAGALGYVMKEQAADEVLCAIRTVLTGEFYVSRKIAILVLRRMVEGRREVNGGETGSLTDREMHVFQLLGAGMSTKRIAAELHLSVKTVETYREHIKHKLGLSCASELIRVATHWVQSRTGNLGLPLTT